MWCETGVFSAWALPDHPTAAPAEITSEIQDSSKHPFREHEGSSSFPLWLRTNQGGLCVPNLSSTLWCVFRIATNSVALRPMRRADSTAPIRGCPIPSATSFGISIQPSRSSTTLKRPASPSKSPYTTRPQLTPFEPSGELRPSILPVWPPRRPAGWPDRAVNGVDLRVLLESILPGGEKVFALRAGDVIGAEHHARAFL